MELAFNFAKRIYNINFVDILLSYIPNQQLTLRIAPRDLHTCNPLVGFYNNCIRHQRERFLSVVEYLYYSLMYNSNIPVEIDKYLADPTEIRVRHLEVKHKFIASFVDRLHSIFTWPKFNRTLRLEPIHVSSRYFAVIRYDAMHVTMRFNYLNRMLAKPNTEPNTTIKILTYLLLLR